MKHARTPLLDIEMDELQKDELDTAVSNHIRFRINRWLKWFGFRSSPIPIIIIVSSYLLANLIMNAVTAKNSQYCLPLNLCVVLFQAESFILYGFAFYSVNKTFIEKVVFQLAEIDVCSQPYKQITNEYIENHDRFTQAMSLQIYDDYKAGNKQTGSRILLHEACKCLLVILPSYLSGFLIYFVSVVGPIGDKPRHVYECLSSGSDFIRYAPLILHIALARSYFQTFPIQLQRLRDSLCVLKRKDDLDYRDCELGKHKLRINHAEFVASCENVIRPYRQLSSKLSAWILIFFLLNIAAFTLFLLSVVSTVLPFGDCHFDDLGLYYLHFLIELLSFFGEWIFLVWPYCSNTSLLQSFVYDVKTMANTSATEKCAIDCYTDSIIERSPFSIYAIQPSYRKLMYLFYIVFATITIDIFTKVYNIKVG
eukprot:103095_1